MSSRFHPHRICEAIARRAVPTALALGGVAQLASAQLSVVPSAPFNPAVYQVRPGYPFPQHVAAPYDTSDNLAAPANGALPAVAKNNISGYPAIHMPAFGNDGFYGNGASWISASTWSWIKIDLGAPRTFDQVLIGRDRFGGFNDRDPGQFIIQIAAADSVYANGDESLDSAEYAQIFASSAHAFSGTIVYAQTWSAQFTQVTARFVKILVERSGACLDEIEVRLQDTPPIADAGSPTSVNESSSVILDGSGSHDPDSDPLTYAWVQLAGTTVSLSNAGAQQPSFTAPSVSIGGETLTFQLTVTANGRSSMDTVSVTVVNVNHVPVAEAGDDQSVAEGSPVTLHGEASFDIDSDAFSYTWVQIVGPAVTLTGNDTATPTFTAPTVLSGGAPGVVATLVFRLTVDDTYPQDAPAPGYTFANAVDTVTVEVTNVNNLPDADASDDQTVNENALVTLNGAASSDPDGDTLTHAWVQVGGPAAILAGANTAVPTFTAPFVAAGGADLTFQLTVDDGYLGTAVDTVVVHVQNVNDPPLAAAARPSTALLWPPNHAMVAIGITGVTDPNNNATIIITGVTQDEPTDGLGDGDTAIDAIINPDGTVLLRAERAGNGNGRVYHISFTASDLEGSSSGVVTVSVPHQKKTVAVDGGPLFNSTN